MQMADFVAWLILTFPPTFPWLAWITAWMHKWLPACALMHTRGLHVLQHRLRAPALLPCINTCADCRYIDFCPMTVARSLAGKAVDFGLLRLVEVGRVNLYQLTDNRLRSHCKYRHRLSRHYYQIPSITILALCNAVSIVHWKNVIQRCIGVSFHPYYLIRPRAVQ